MIYSNNIIPETANIFTTWSTKPAHIILSFTETFSSEVHLKIIYLII